MANEINHEERKGYITGAVDLAREKAEGAIDAYKRYSRLFERLHKNREIADYNPLAPKFDKKDADNFVVELSDLMPEIIGIIKNYKEYTIKLTKSIIELKHLTK
ncbi:MAG: hypothetical protein ACOYU0_07050 [Nitrospirota bacterium]